ncbi:non-canonical purine NTP pyrophosphatase [Carboxydochorda subterranea]|uniref:dITP/XTP pyrophosphatase n=1 Tax=Carboxydichorda subterranea TaxID=3109565 RepID=A0ABZ1BZ49_9FIRM|nr:non-canonical purine NTP pyrophosphatase [Limnochorda sp. L945t]WRP18047.1 non-canonical purine NTP pyrophosphatase [Limnochorda sp. L945t]
MLASTNRGKLEEYRALAESGMLDRLVEIVLPGELASHGRPMPEVPEESLDLRVNAAAKARAAAAAFGLVAVADDTGLEVDALGGAPGPRAARWAGPDATDADRIRLLLERLRGVPVSRRTARFRCAVAVAEPPAGPSTPGRVWVREAALEGQIALAPRGDRGFGYDPLFVVPGLGKTFAELSREEKNQVSHRARAWRAAEPLLVRLIVAPESPETLPPPFEG